MKKSSKVAGVLGGMGPYASAAFYKTILDLTPAKKDWDHIRLIIDSNPHIPGRSRYHLFGEESPVAGMIESCRQLERYPVDFIVIPCNSASFFLPEIQPAINIPILNIMEITVQALARRDGICGRVVVLGGIITYEKKTYEKLLAGYGCEYVHHAESMQRKVEALIEQIKINTDYPIICEGFNEIITEIREGYEASAVILGCTELEVFADYDCPLHILDSSRELALRTVEYACQ